MVTKRTFIALFKYCTVTIILMSLYRLIKVNIKFEAQDAPDFALMRHFL